MTCPHQNIRLFACIGITNEDTMRILIVPEQRFIPPGGILFLRTIKILARYEIGSDTWKGLEQLYGKLYNPRDVTGTVLLLRWIVGTMNIGDGANAGSAVFSSNVYVDTLNIKSGTASSELSKGVFAGVLKTKISRAILRPRASIKSDKF